MNDLTKQFLNEYDEGDLKFNNLQYRKGARVTCEFGLAEGFEKVDDKIQGGFVRIHSGVDRGSHNNSGLNTVIAPFTFQRSKYIEYSEDHVYGSVTRLFNDIYKFELRIMHIEPEELAHEFKYLTANNFEIPRNTVIGKAGSRGFSTGRHTHTEIISYEKSSVVLDDILEMKYREHAFIPYSQEEIINFYKTQSFWKDERRKAIFLSDYETQIEKRKIEGGLLNEFSYLYFDWYNQSLCTRYSSSRLFNGL